ncbi:MAG: UTP--glucose-1-phosphate uridylyltransferase GalU [Porticoccaceae bacterium]|nr:UTP--glucose-1-phosphate uridylyltransferase GalU [Porticoccaceae bacterium]
MIKKCLFPVAGYGTRFLPATKSMPKEMLTVVNKPLVQYGVEEALAAGLDEICFVTGRGKRAIIDHFDVSYELEHQIAGSNKEAYLTSVRNLIEQGKFASTRQSEMKGLGHAILTGELLVGNQPFGIILADDLCLNEGPGVISQLAEIYRRTGTSVIAIQEVGEQDVSKFGVIAGDEEEPGLYRVTDMVEKPEPEDAPSNLAIIGRYVLSPEIFDILRETPPGKDGEVQLTDALLTLAKTGKVYAYKFDGKRFDCGSVDGFVEATNHVYENIYLPEQGE